MIHEMTKSPERFQIDQLLNEAAFPHPVSEMRLLETHISWIILTGEFAYKIKKPVSFDFVDYSTLEQRKINCQKEVELNSRYCPAIYLDVVPIFLKRGEQTKFLLRFSKPSFYFLSQISALTLVPPQSEINTLLFLLFCKRIYFRRTFGEGKI